MKNTIPLKKKLRIYIGDMVDKWKKLIPQTDNGFRVLLYHSITDKLVDKEWEENTIPKDLFDRQMKYLADNEYNIISCRQAIQHLTDHREIPLRAIVITFDDGYKNNYINALPVLKKHNFCATIFLTINFLRDYSANAQYLSSSEVINMKKSGIIDFGNHGLTHRALTMLDEQQLNEEIGGAKHKLEGIVNDKIDLFAYPFGHIGSYNKNITKTVKSAGFAGAYTTIFGLNDLKTNPFLIRRNRISWLDELSEFEKHLSGAYDWCSLFEYLRYKRYR